GKGVDGARGSVPGNRLTRGGSLAVADVMDLGHPLVHLARRIDWELLDGRFASVCAAGAHKAGALATGDLEHVEVDTNVQPKAIAHPTDARLCHRALEKLVDLAKHYDVPLRQSYRRVWPSALRSWLGATPMPTSSSGRGAN